MINLAFRAAVLISVEVRCVISCKIKMCLLKEAAWLSAGTLKHSRPNKNLS